MIRILAVTLAVFYCLSANAQTAPLAPEAQKVIAGQIQAFRAQQHEEAFSYATDNLQRMFGSTERFIGMVRQGYMPIYGAKSWAFERSRMQGDMLLQEVRLVGPKGREWMALYTMERLADGSWRIAAVRMVPATSRMT